MKKQVDFDKKLKSISFQNECCWCDINFEYYPGAVKQIKSLVKEIIEEAMPEAAKEKRKGEPITDMAIGFNLGLDDYKKSMLERLGGEYYDIQNTA